MKLLTSIRRELTLLSRSVYFYVEIAVAAVFLAALLTAIPEKFDARVTEYLFIDAPPEQARAMVDALYEGAGAYTVEEVSLKSRGSQIPALLYTSDLKYQYVVGSRDDLVALCEDTGHVGTAMASPGSVSGNVPGSVPAIEVYLQGNETPRYKDYALLAVSADAREIAAAADDVEVRALEGGQRALTDRQSVLPLMLTVNCVLMGVFVTAAYIVEDKKTKVIKALRVLPARMGAYLAAKMAAVILTALATCLIIAAPVMGGGANYLLLCLTVVCGGFFNVSIGALLASFFDDIGKAFATVFLILIVMMIPGALSMAPTVNAAWAKAIPSYYVVESIKESLLGRDAGYVLSCCAALAAGGLALTPFTARRYKAAGIGVGG